MWGNLRGWIISALMLLGTAGMLIAIGLPPRESAPAGLIKDAFKPIQLPVSPDAVTAAGVNEGNAGDLYRQAIDEFFRNRAQYENGNAARVDASKLPAFALILMAADCANMHLLDANPKEAINYDNKKPWIEALSGLGQSTGDAGLRLRDDNPKEAEKYYRAAFNLGRNMFNERVTWEELNHGISIMRMGAEGLTKLADNAKDGKRVDDLVHFTTLVADYQNTLQEKVASPISNPIENPVDENGSWRGGRVYAGDIFAIAKDPTVERVWRVEAILHIGRYRWNVGEGHAGNQRAGPKELDALSKSPDQQNQDLVIKTAIQAAQNLTETQQRMTAGGS